MPVVVLGRSREGAWIEIDLITKMPFSCFVAPARERGLKFSLLHNLLKLLLGRSREGAWIEI